MMNVPQALSPQGIAARKVVRDFVRRNTPQTMIDQLALQASVWPDMDQAEVELRNALFETFRVNWPEVSEARAVGLSVGLASLVRDRLIEMQKVGHA